LVSKIVYLYVEGIATDPPPRIIINFIFFIFIFFSFILLNVSDYRISDGTTAGTKLLIDLYPGSTGSSPGQFKPLNNFIYFAGNNPTDGTEFFRTDGTNVNLVKDICVGSGNADIMNSVVVPSKGILMQANDCSSSAELWFMPKYV
jgi:ELWxxDGT repeat protein